MKKSKRRLSLLLALSLSIIPSVSMIGETISHAQTIPKKNKLILSNEFISQIDKFVKVIVSWSKKAPNGFITDIAWTLNYRMYEI